MPLITPFDPWRNPLCSCPKKLSLSAYSGCSHGCLYCYASSYVRNFYSPRPKKNFLNLLENEIKKLPPKSLIAIANSSDPYQPIEKNLRLTRAALRIIKKYDLKINIVTKSAIVLDDLEILKDIPKTFVSLTITTLNTKLAGKIEPQASTPKERFKAMEKLAKSVVVACRFDPLIYPLNTGEAAKLIKEAKNSGARQVITSTYKAKPANLRKMAAAFPEYKKLWQELYTEGGEFNRGYIYLARRLREEIIRKIKEITAGFNMEFSSCREGFGAYNTTACDGSLL